MQMMTPSNTIKIDPPQAPQIPDHTLSITEHGAVEGGKTLNTEAIAAAIEAAHAAGGERVVVPAGVWLTAPIHFKDRIELHLEEGAELRFSQNPEDYLPVVFMQRGGAWCYTYSPFIYGRNCSDVAVTGSGTLNGQGESWWPWKKKQPGMVRLRQMVADRTPLDQRVFGTVEDEVRPSFLQVLQCNRVLIEGVKFIDSPSWTLHPVQCNDLTIRGVTVKNPPHAPNTDGIDPDACCRVLIEHCHVDTGDDGICLKSGWNEDGWEAGIPCEDVLIRHYTVLSAHGGFVIGSDVSGGVRKVHAHDCVFEGTDIGVRIKTKPGRGTSHLPDRGRRSDTQPGSARIFMSKPNIRSLGRADGSSSESPDGRHHESTTHSKIPLAVVGGDKLTDTQCLGAGDMQRIEGAAAGLGGGLAGNFAAECPGRTPIDRGDAQDPGLNIGFDVAGRPRSLAQAALPSKRLQAKGGNTFGMMKCRKTERFAVPSHPAANGVGFRFLRIQLQEDTGVDITGHRSPRLSATNASLEDPFQFPPQVARARFLKSGKVTGAEFSSGERRATGFLWRVITTGWPASTSRNTLARLCWASMIEMVFITHKVTHN